MLPILKEIIKAFFYGIRSLLAIILIMVKEILWWQVIVLSWGIKKLKVPKKPKNT